MTDEIQEVDGEFVDEYDDIPLVVITTRDGYTDFRILGDAEVISIDYDEILVHGHSHIPQDIVDFLPYFSDLESEILQVLVAHDEFVAKQTEQK